MKKLRTITIEFESEDLTEDMADDLKKTLVARAEQRANVLFKEAQITDCSNRYHESHHSFPALPYYYAMNDVWRYYQEHECTLRDLGKFFDRGNKKIRERMEDGRYAFRSYQDRRYYHRNYIGKPELYFEYIMNWVTLRVLEDVGIILGKNYCEAPNFKD